MTEHDIRDIVKRHREFLDRSRKRFEALRTEGRVPPELILEEGEAELSRLRTRLERIEAARKAAVERYDEEIRRDRDAIKRSEAKLDGLRAQVEGKAEPPPADAPTEPRDRGGAPTQPKPRRRKKKEGT